MMKKVYHKPSTTVLSYVMLKDVCVDAASDGDNAGGIAKKDPGYWEEDESDEVTINANIWAK